jgi:hypothetical protein
MYKSSAARFQASKKKEREHRSRPFKYNASYPSEHNIENKKKNPKRG